MATRALKGQEPKAAKPSKPKILIFGKPGVGKTWAALDFPSVYYVDTEGGANLEHYTAKLHASGGRYFGPEQGSLDFPTVIEEVITLATIQHKYRTLVIDSFSKLFNTAYAQTTERMEKAGEKVAFANDKKEAIGFARRLVRWIDKLDMNTILVCHEKDRWSNGEVIGQTFDGWDKLEYELHLNLRVEKQGGNRIARVYKTRLEQFPDATIFPWSFAEFAKRYGQSVMETAAAPISVASEDQVKQLEELIELLKIPSEQTDRWLEAGGAESWREMPADKVAKAIETLTKKLPQRAA
jgi:hypothetical protein